MTPESYLPPQNLEAERGVIAAALIDPETLHDTAAILKAGAFFREAHQTIWAAILRLFDAGSAIDAVSLADELTRRGQFKAVGGHEAIGEIVNSVPHAANATFHAKVVHQKATARGVIQACEATLRDGYSGTLTASELVAVAESRVFAISEAEATGDTRDMADVVGDAYIAIENRKQGRVDGVRTGFADLDYHLDAMQPGALVILAARPSQGKTAMAMGISSHVAGNYPGYVLFVSLEMGRQEVGERLLSATANIPGDKLKRPWGMSDAERERLANAAHELQRSRIKIDDTPLRTLTQIGANARRVASRSGLSLLVIDYLSLIDGQRQKGENRQEEVARLSRGLKALARQLSCPVLCLSQLNRHSENRGKDRQPRLSDLRESGQIEQDADAVVMLHRPSFYDPNDQPGIAEVIIAKNRNGPTGAVKLVFVGDCTRFDSLAPNYPEVENPNHGQPY